MKEQLSKLISKLQELPGEIAELQTNALALNDSIQLVSEEIVRRESEIKSEINAATDENGKKLYSKIGRAHV
jgi:predicted  nucleic acid-binding Zn-ribbon protein